MNQKIISSSEDFILKYAPKSIFLASSGAAYEKGIKQNEHTCYGKLKVEQEERVALASKIGESVLTVCRIFNLSGRHISKSSTFALANFFSSAKQNLRIEINSCFPVFRRYCLDEEIVELALNLMSQGESHAFDSGGYKVELRDLAILVAELVGKEIQLEFPEIDHSIPASNYFSTSNKYEELLEKNLGRKPASIAIQLKETYEGMLENEQLN